MKTFQQAVPTCLLGRCHHELWSRNSCQGALVCEPLPVKQVVKCPLFERTPRRPYGRVSMLLVAIWPNIIRRLNYLNPAQGLKVFEIVLRRTGESFTY